MVNFTELNQILISEFYLYELSLKDLYKCNYMRIKICQIFHTPKASKNLLPAEYVRLMMPYLQVPHHVYLLYLSGTYRICSWHFCRSLTDILLSVTNLKKDKEHMLQLEGSERDIGCFWLQNRHLNVNFCDSHSDLWCWLFSPKLVWYFYWLISLTKLEAWVIGAQTPAVLA